METHLLIALILSFTAAVDVIIAFAVVRPRLEPPQQNIIVAAMTTGAILMLGLAAAFGTGLIAL